MSRQERPSYPRQTTPSYDAAKIDQYAPTRHPDILPADRAARTLYARMLGMDATIYGLVAVYQYREMYRQAIHRESPDYVGFNRFAHDRELAGPGYVAFKTPNVDTIYSNAWLDLTHGPVLIEAPAFGNRYYTLQFLDMYGNTSNISLRTKGPEANRYLIATTRWQGDVPVGAKLFRVATPYMWILMRIFPADESDLGGAHALQDAVKITPLAADADANRASPAIGGAYPSGSVDDPAGFFTALDFVIRSCGHPVQEDALTYRYRTIGIGGLEPLEFVALDPETQEAMRAGFADAMEVIAASRWQIGIPLASRWTKAGQKAAYGFNFLIRAVINKLGLGANVIEENQSFTTFRDEEGEQLDGSKGRYVYHFDEPPPVEAFWSLTMYEMNTGELYPNSMNRYLISDRTAGLKYGPDGSLTIWIQHDRPADTANWLPAPAGPFYMAIRNYMPRPELLEGKWLPEAVRKVGD